MIKLMHGDCLELMSQIKSGSVDFVFGDIPYGTTRCKWDSQINLAEMWAHLKRVCKENAAMVFTASQPFTTALISSNLKMFRYCWVWEKTTPTGHLNAKKMPMKSHEDVAVFYRRLPVYNPQKTTGHDRKVATALHRRGSKATEVYGDFGLHTYDSTERYPRSVLKISTDKQKSQLMPTQKPVKLVQYFVETYTNKGNVVLDMTMGSGTAGVACRNTERSFIGIEIDLLRFRMAKSRIEERRLIRS